MGGVNWELYGTSPKTCARKADHGFGVCVPLALSLSFENSELNCSAVPTLHSKFFEILKFDRIFVRSCAHVLLRKI